VITVTVVTQAGANRPVHALVRQDLKEETPMPEMKPPGPDHPLTFTPSHRRVRALYNGHLIADSGAAVIARESTYPPVVYIPKADIEMEVLHPTTHASFCPYKGDASYWTINRDGQIAENAGWSYETPFPASTAISGFIAFYPNVVTIEEYDTPPSSGVDQAMSDYIRHTDSGSGRSQDEHWAPTVGQHEPDGLPPV
jgi:uncharacterized protein (DUF427 family)